MIHIGLIDPCTMHPLKFSRIIYFGKFFCLSLQFRKTIICLSLTESSSKQSSAILDPQFSSPPLYLLLFCFEQYVSTEQVIKTYPITQCAQYHHLNERKVFNFPCLIFPLSNRFSSKCNFSILMYNIYTDLSLSFSQL